MMLIEVWGWHAVAQAQESTAPASASAKPVKKPKKEQAAELPPYESGIVWPEPVVVDPGPELPPVPPPSDAVVLFAGQSLDAWKGGEKWEIRDGVAISKGGSITTKQSFGDCQVHLEWASPTPATGNDQGRGNSGLYLMGKYEIQILDSYQNKTYFDGQCGAVYKQKPPLVNACRPPGQWQSFDIFFTAPRFDENGSLLRPAYVTVLHNNILIQQHTELLGATDYRQPPAYRKHPAQLPMNLQFHGNPVRFRNIWVRELKPIIGQKPDGTKTDSQ